ncbi:MAG: hypothetical protein AB7F28_07535 [Candidatus Margulisiibacteriota bacterium]
MLARVERTAVPIALKTYQAITVLARQHGTSAQQPHTIVLSQHTGKVFDEQFLLHLLLKFSGSQKPLQLLMEGVPAGAEDDFAQATLGGPSNGRVFGLEPNTTSAAVLQLFFDHFSSQIVPGTETRRVTLLISSARNPLLQRIAETVGTETPFAPVFRDLNRLKNLSLLKDPEHSSPLLRLVSEPRWNEVQQQWMKAVLADAKVHQALQTASPKLPQAIQRLFENPYDETAQIALVNAQDQEREDSMTKRIIQAFFDNQNAGNTHTLVALMGVGHKKVAFRVNEATRNAFACMGVCS